MKKSTKKERIVIVSGFSGSGKSGVVERIGKEFRLRVIYTSQLLKKIRKLQSKTHSKTQLKNLEIKSQKKVDGWWEGNEGKKFLKERLKEAKSDKLLDEILLKEIKKGNLVMDSWTMAYLQKKGFKIWLHASLEERAKRLSKRDKMPYKTILESIKEKEQLTAKIYKKIYGFEFGKNLELFDLVLNTDLFNEKEVHQIIVTALKKIL